jgi:uncharacterized Zn-finger protein
MSLPSELDKKSVEVTAKDLPLHCPLPSQKLWNTHPRVYLPIENVNGSPVLRVFKPNP